MGLVIVVTVSCYDQFLNRHPVEMEALNIGRLRFHMRDLSSF